MQGRLGWAEWQSFIRGTRQDVPSRRSHRDLIQCPQFVNDAGDGYFEGRASFTAADGDMPVLTYDLDWRSSSPTSVLPTARRGRDVERPRGRGSRRFADATGSGMLDVIGVIPFEDTQCSASPPGGRCGPFDGMICVHARVGPVGDIRVCES